MGRRRCGRACGCGGHPPTLAFPPIMDHVVGGGPERADAALAQSGGAFEAVVWMAGLVLVLIAAAVVLAWYRSRWRGSMSTARDNFTLDDLRRMRDRGDLTGAEYERLRAIVIADFGASSHRVGRNGAA